LSRFFLGPCKLAIGLRASAATRARRRSDSGCTVHPLTPAIADARRTGAWTCASKGPTFSRYRIILRPEATNENGGTACSHPPEMRQSRSGMHHDCMTTTPPSLWPRLSPLGTVVPRSRSQPRLCEGLPPGPARPNHAQTDKGRLSSEDKILGCRGRRFCETRADGRARNCGRAMPRPGGVGSRVSLRGGWRATQWSRTHSEKNDGNENAWSFPSLQKKAQFCRRYLARRISLRKNPNHQARAEGFKFHIV